MKKTFLFLLILLSTYIAVAQVSAGPVLAFGFANVKGGVNDQPNKFKFAFRAGAFLRLEFSDALSLQPEMFYSSRGYNQKTSFSNSNTTKDTILTHRFSYIDFPFMLNMKIGDNAFMCIGPQIGYIANAKRKGTISFTSGSTVLTQVIDTNDVYGFSTTEYSLALGGGYRFDKIPLLASLRINYGLTKLYDGKYFSHNLSFYVSVSYVFGGDGGVGRGGGSTIYKRI